MGSAGALRRSLGVGILLLLVSAGAVGSAETEAAGPVVRGIDIIGTSTITPQQIRAMMGTRVGQPLDQKTLDEDFQRLNRMPEIADAQIKQEPADNGVRLTVVIRERDVIRRIQFQGNKEYREQKLEEVIQTKIGERFDAGKVNRDVRAIQDLYREEFYYFVNVTPKTDPYEDGLRLTFDIEEKGRVYIKDVMFRGNDSFSKKELLKYMETRPSTLFARGKYDRRTFERDLERLRMFYQSKGYLDIQVQERPFEMKTGESGLFGRERTDTIIYIDINEGERYRVSRVEFEGNNLVDDEKLRALVETAPGEFFSPVTAQKDANLIRDTYGAFPSSRYFTKVFAERLYTEEGPIVDVIFHVSEGQEVVVEDVQILGLTKTQDRVVRREIEQLPGEKIDSEKINESKRNLHNLGYFKTINFDVKPGSDEGNRARVVVDVEEASTGKLVLGAGISSRESFVGSIQLSERNFAASDWPESLRDFITGKAFKGGGQKFDVNVSAGSKSETYKFDFLEPWFFDRPIRVGFGGFYKTFEWQKYDEERTGGYLRLGKQLFGNKHLDGSITYKAEHVTLSDFDDDVSAYLRNEEGSNWINRIVTNVTWDNRDSIWDPTKGLHLSGTYEVAHNVLGGDKNFWRGFLDGSYFHQVYKDSSDRPWVLALHGELSAAESMGDDDAVPVQEKLYLGGIGSVRGFRYHSISPRDDHGDEIGGELATAMSAEFFVPLYQDVLRASAFYDIGAVWDDIEQMDGDPWRSSVGLGLHVRTPLSPMPIRLYYTRALDEVDGDDTETFQFTFGAFF